jgi:multidrug efflux pump
LKTASAGPQFQYTLEDASAGELNTWTNKLVQKLQTLPELRDLATDQQTLGSQAKLVIDRVTASRLGITPQAIDNVLYDAFGQRQITTLFTQLNQYHLILEALPEFQKHPAKLNNIYLKSNSGGAVPLSAFTHFESGTAPLAINRQGQFPSVTISFNLAPGVALGQAVTAIQKAQKELGMPLSVQASFQGTAAAFQASLKNEPWLILAAIVAVYIVLGVLYESYIHPITILSTLPSAGVGALLALLVCRSELGVVALIWNHSPDRHREKERDYDHRLRVRRPAQRTQRARRRDLPGMPPPLPTHHDDDLRRPLRRTTPGAWQRGRR